MFSAKSRVDESSRSASGEKGKAFAYKTRFLGIKYCILRSRPFQRLVAFSLFSLPVRKPSRDFAIPILVVFRIVVVVVGNDVRAIREKKTFFFLYIRAMLFRTNSIKACKYYTRIVRENGVFFYVAITKNGIVVNRIRVAESKSIFTDSLVI